MQVRPQEEMANPQGMKMFAVERKGLSEDFVYFRALCGVQSPPLVFAPIVCLGMVRSRVRHRGRLCVSCLRSPELSAEVRGEKSCISCTHAQMGAYSTCNGRNG